MLQRPTVRGGREPLRILLWDEYCPTCICPSRA
ncbi:hypothetical protein HRbin11_00445 [bacterium HR11]|nr:hypothetical protein HRbin11_00445 [bacterium HR11]